MYSERSMSKTVIHSTPAAFEIVVSAATAQISSRMQGVYSGEAIACGSRKGALEVLQEKSVLNFMEEEIYYLEFEDISVHMMSNWLNRFKMMSQRKFEVKNLEMLLLS
jgi:hypothetical protein